MNNVLVPNRQAVLLKLVNAFFAEHETGHQASSSVVSCSEISHEATMQHQLRLKSMLCTFFHGFVDCNKNQYDMCKLAIFLFKFKLEKNASVSSLKKIATWFYDLAHGGKGLRQLMVESILDQVIQVLGDYCLIQKWMNILLEFEIHQCDVEEKNPAALEDLKRILTKTEKITVWI